MELEQLLQDELVDAKLTEPHKLAQTEVADNQIEICDKCDKTFESKQNRQTCPECISRDADLNLKELRIKFNELVLARSIMTGESQEIARKAIIDKAKGKLGL